MADRLRSKKNLCNLFHATLLYNNTMQLAIIIPAHNETHGLETNLVEFYSAVKISDTQGRVVN